MSKAEIVPSLSNAQPLRFGGAAGTSFRVLIALGVALGVAACASGSNKSLKGTNPAIGNGSTNAPDASTAPPASKERPFAGSAGEATALISTVVDERGADIGMCVRDFRVRKKLVHERVSVSFGIDMEGRLLGVTSKGKEDAELKACVQEALRGAIFPRSNAGVISVTKTYGELLQ